MKRRFRSTLNTNNKGWLFQATFCLSVFVCLSVRSEQTKQTRQTEQTNIHTDRQTEQSRQTDRTVRTDKHTDRTVKTVRTDRQTDGQSFFCLSDSQKK